VQRTLSGRARGDPVRRLNKLGRSVLALPAPKTSLPGCAARAAATAARLHARSRAGAQRGEARRRASGCRHPPMHRRRLQAPTARCVRLTEPTRLSHPARARPRQLSAHCPATPAASAPAQLPWCRYQGCTRAAWFRFTVGARVRAPASRSTPAAGGTCPRTWACAAASAPSAGKTARGANPNARSMRRADRQSVQRTGTYESRGHRQSVQPLHARDL